MTTFKDLKIIIEKINQQKTKTIRGSYTLEVYEQVAKTGFIQLRKLLLLFQILTAVKMI